MAENLKEIDTSAIEKLVEIKEQKDRLETFRDKAEEMKEKVDEAVYERVLSDYKGRAGELEHQAAPLKAEARREYRKLRTIFDELGETEQQAALDKEELEFRHAVGELGKDELAERLKEPEGILKSCQKGLKDADKLKKSFLEAFDSEEDLEAEVEEAVGEAAGVSADEDADLEATLDDAGVDVDATIVGSEPGDEASPLATAVLTPEEEEESASTTVLPPDELEPEATVVFSADGLADAGGTQVLPQARLVMLENGEEGKEFHLSAINYVGRADDNHIQIAVPTVSRKHALIEAAADGFVVKDLGSDNGTLVNEEHVEEHLLADGDRITLGDVDLVFHSQ